MDSELGYMACLVGLLASPTPNQKITFPCWFYKVKSNFCRKNAVRSAQFVIYTCSCKPPSTQQRLPFLYVTLLFWKKTDNVKYLNSSLLLTLSVPPRCCAIVLVTLFVKKKQKARQALVAKSNSIAGTFLEIKKAQRSSTTPTRGRHAS